VISELQEQNLKIEEKHQKTMIKASHEKKELELTIKTLHENF
jgi:hypothetical protein